VNQKLDKFQVSGQRERALNEVVCKAYVRSNILNPDHLLSVRTKSELKA
jgi:hypothetical protein